MKYRTERFGSSGERDFIDVVTFEIRELGNSDILEYVADNILNGTEFEKEIRKMLTEFEENGYIDDFSEKDWNNFITRMRDEIEKRLNVELNYVLWLADKNNAYRYYMACENSCNMENSYEAPDDISKLDIDKYDESNGVVLSNLGVDGALYGFTDMPIPINE